MSRLRRRLPSPHSLFAFEAAARLLNFRLAADELNVTQPSISHAVKQLERFHNVKLFRRRNRGVQLTEAGRLLYEGVRTGFDTIERALQALAAGEANYLTVAISDAVSAYWFVPQLQSFHQKHPNIRIKMVTTDRDLEPDFHIDLTIWVRPKEFKRKNIWYVCDEIVMPVCSPLYLSKAKPIRSVEDLWEHPLIHYHDPHRPRMQWHEWFAKVGARVPEAPPKIVFNEHLLAVQTALAGGGIALGWSLTAQLLLKNGLLVRPLDLEVNTGRAFFVVAREWEEPSDEVMALVRWIVATANA
ncbi:MAG: LysR family transcriptional regulator [Geminicoccaceae bacterium]|jgi:LysR family glycine cleavage system transcriptional activator|nr:MAG: LysR family transcriptional regulator [Geminicoccaceae bacterium]